MSEIPKGLLGLEFEGDDVIFRDHEGKEAGRWTEADRQELRSTLSDMGWSARGDLTIDVGGACPVQGEGTLDGFPIYFRARGEHWAFSIAQNRVHDPVNVSWDEVPGWWTECEYGDNFAAGWMSGEHSRLCVAAAIAAWRALGGADAPLGKYETTGAPMAPAEVKS